MPMSGSASITNSTGRVYRVVLSQPNWLVRCVLMTIGALVVVLALLIVLPLMLIGLVAFLALVLVGIARASVRSLFAGGGGLRRSSEGRENVRVIRRDGPSA